jgi:hypothetical protein
MRMPLVDIRGSDFEHSLAGNELAAAKAQLKSAFAVEKTFHQKMIADFKSGTPGYPAVSCYLNSGQVMLACAVQAGKKVPKRHRPTLETLLGIPSKLTLEKPLGEIDWIRLEPKHSGGFRFIHDFGPLHRTVKQMVLRVLECRFVPKPFQFTPVGIQKPIALAKKSILEGRVHFATLDITNHFGSFRRKKLASLLPMLPKAWVDYVVLGRHVVMKWKENSYLHNTQNVSSTELLYLARSGIPAGSICSPIIAAHSISMLQWANSSAKMWNYADNFLLLATSDYELTKSVEELKAAVGALPGGHFMLKLISEGHVEDGLEFLGHRLRLKGNKIKTEPNISNQESIYAEGMKMGQRVTLALNEGNKAEALYYVKKYCAKVKGWLAFFTECDEIAEWESTFQSLIAQNAWLPVTEIEQMMVSVQGEFEYTGDDYQYV